MGWATVLWTGSNHARQDHLTRAAVAGIETYHVLVTGAPAAQVRFATLAPEDQDKANAGKFTAISGTPTPAYETYFTLKSTGDHPSIDIRETVQIGTTR